MPGRKTIANAPSGENSSLAGTEKVPISGSQYTLISSIAAYIRTLTQTLTNKTINLGSNTLTGTTAQFNTANSDGDFATLAGSETLTNKTLTTPTISGAITFPDNTRQTFNPGANAAGLNVGSHAGDPDTPTNGDLWYDSSANELTARINGSNVALGAGGGGGDVSGPASSTDHAIARWDGAGGDTLQDTSAVTLSDAGAFTFPDNVRQTFNPGANAAGINVGAVAGDPDTPTNGDLWYDSSANELTARINGANVALGAGGAGDVATDTIWDAKGDLAVGTGANTAQKLSAGTDGQYLVAASGETTGLQWVTGGRVLIASSTPTGTGTVSFTSISSGYSKLVIEYVARGTQAAATVAMDIELNNDTTNGNYRRQHMNAHTTTTLAGNGGDDNLVNDSVLAGTAPSNEASYGKIEIPFYAGTTFNKQIRAWYSHRRDTSSVQQQLDYRGIDWESTSAVNRVDLILSAGNFDTGSTIRLYGEY